jgi:MFS family permease
MRGQGIAIYMLFGNLIGYGFGPTVTAAIMDYWFRSDAALNKSLALGGLLIIPVSTLLILLSLPAVRRHVGEAQGWQSD